MAMDGKRERERERERERDICDVGSPWWWWWWWCWWCAHVIKSRLKVCKTQKYVWYTLIYNIGAWPKSYIDCDETTSLTHVLRWQRKYTTLCESTCPLSTRPQCRFDQRWMSKLFNKHSKSENILCRSFTLETSWLLTCSTNLFLSIRQPHHFE